MKYYTNEMGYSIPVLSKGWKAMWLVAGLIANFLAPLFAFFYYPKKLPNFPTVRKVALKFSLIGVVAGIIIRTLLATL